MADEKSSVASKKRPYLLLDVDGVLNCTPTPTMQQMLQPQWRDGNATTQCRTYRLWWQTPVVEKLNELHRAGLLELRWLTTWLHDARSEVGTLLELDDFPFLERTTGGGFPDRDWWKLQSLRDLMAADRRPFCWLDDQLHPAMAAMVEKEFGDGNLLVAPESNPGLTLAHLETVEKWASAFC